MKIFFNKHWTIKIVILSLFFLGIGASPLQAQTDIDLNACDPTPVVLQSQVAGVPITGIPTINVVHVSGGSLSISVQTVDFVSPFAANVCTAPCPNPLVFNGIQIAVSGASVTISGTPDASLAGVTIGFTLRGQDGTNPDCERTYSFAITRRPIDLVMVLDKSGSMNALVTGGTQTRWDALKAGVNQFLANYQPQLLSSGGAEGDQMGIRMFSSTDVAPVNAPFNVNQTIPVTPGSVLFSILDGDSPGGSTAMGAGLTTATSFLFPGGADNGHKKAILLFTDGQQNVAPLVVAAPGSNPTVSGTDITNSDQVEIHTIGLGVAGSATQTLYNIAHESGVAPNNGITNIADNSSSTPPDLNLSSYLMSITTQLLSGSSPQHVGIRRDRFQLIGSLFGAEEQFEVSKGIDHIFVNFVSAVSNEARIGSIQKNGQAINLSDTSSVLAKRGPGWQTYRISVAAIQKKIPSFTSDGTWQVNMVSFAQQAAPYVLSLTVDDHHTKMIGRTTQTKELVVGDALPLSVQFSKRSGHVEDATVMAIIGKPKDDLGDLLARTKADVKIDTAADADNPGTQKLLELLKDSAFLQKLLDSNHAVNLTWDASKQAYVGEFNQLDVSGVYQVAYLISTTDTALGEIKRYAEESVYVRFPEVNLDSSQVVLTATQNGGTLTFRPIAVNGKFIGPGWGNAIKIDGAGTKITHVVDNLDGSYTVTIEGDLSEDVTVSIGTATIYTGALEDMVKGSDSGTDIWQQWWFWLIVIVILLVLILLFRKKNP